MNEKIKKVIEDLTRDCSPEDKEKILYLAAPEEHEEGIKLDFTEEEQNRLMPILDQLITNLESNNKELDAEYKSIFQELKAEEQAANESKKLFEKFKMQLEKARKFRQSHYKIGLRTDKACYLLRIEHNSGIEGIINAFDYGYMLGFKAAQKEAREKLKRQKLKPAAAEEANQEP